MTIDSAAMMVWLTPSTTVRRAIGSCTLVSRCQPVEPSEVAASTVFSGTSRMPCAVNRTAGGSA